MPEVTLCLSMDLPSPKLVNGTYDNLDQLDVASGLFGDRDYNLDRNGNRKQAVADGETALTPRLSEELHRRKRKTSRRATRLELHPRCQRLRYRQDLHGSGPDRLFAYSAHNRLVQVSEDDGTVTIQGEYASGCQRVRKDAGGESFENRYGLGGSCWLSLMTPASPSGSLST